MSIAVVGARGQLGAELVSRLGDRARPIAHQEMEISDPVSVHAALARLEIGAVINCAAYNLVDQAEQEPERAFAVNAFGPRNLARACAARGVPLVHVSSDYVFGLEPSRDRPYTEDDPPGPVNAYGISKAAGEAFVRCETPQHLIIRTCGLYGVPAPGSKGNFVRNILKLAAEKEELRIVADQRCTPTSVPDLAAALLDLLKTQAWGTYHAVNGGDCSWFECAREIVALRGLPTRVLPSATSGAARPARRPAYSVLDSSRLAEVLGRPLRPWRSALADYLAALPE